MKKIFFILISTGFISSTSHATDVGMLTCLIKDQNVRLDIINQTTIKDGYLFDIPSARYTDMTDAVLVQNDESAIKITAKLGSQNLTINYDRTNLMPLASKVKIGESEQACECFYGEYSY